MFFQLPHEKDSQIVKMHFKKRQTPLTCLGLGGRDVGERRGHQRGAQQVKLPGKIDILTSHHITDIPPSVERETCFP